MSSMAEIQGQAVSARVIYCTLAHWCERGLVEHTCATKPATKKARPHNKCLLKKPIQIASLELSPFYMHFFDSSILLRFTLVQQKTRQSFTEFARHLWFLLKQPSEVCNGTCSPVKEFPPRLIGGWEPWIFMTFHSVGDGIIIPTDVNSMIFQRGRFKPPTSYPSYRCSSMLTKGKNPPCSVGIPPTSRGSIKFSGHCWGASFRRVEWHPKYHGCGCEWRERICGG